MHLLCQILHEKRDAFEAEQYARNAVLEAVDA